MMKLVLSFLLMGSLQATSLEILDVVVQDHSCWPVDAFLELVSWEGKDPLLDGPPHNRRYALKKCANVAQKHGFRFFALKEESICFTGPLVDFKYTIGTPCYTEDETIHLYQVNGITDAKFVPLGCRQVDPDADELMSLDLYFPTPMVFTKQEILKECGRLAARLGFTIFTAIDGFCYAWRGTLEDVRKFPKDWNCSVDISLYIPTKHRRVLELYHMTQISYNTFVNLGCWKRDPLSRTIPLIESRSDILDSRNYKLRLDAVKECAMYNADQGHQIFALTDGGACAGTPEMEPAYDEIGPSDDCPLDGKGGKDANQVYKIIRKVKNITFEPLEPFSPLRVTPLGCWKVQFGSLIPTLETADEFLHEDPRSREDAIQKCAKAAQRRGWDVIALRDGRCHSSKNARSLFQVYGHSDKCVDGLGNDDAISVFEINIVRDPWFTNEGCFERCKPIDILEGLHPLLEDNARSRLDRIKKCAHVASIWKYDSFALLNGGVCHGLRWNITTGCIRSAACSDEGLGGRQALQIYKIKEFNNFALQNLGCWRDDAFRTVPVAEGATAELTGRFTNREDPIGACARYARSRGFRVFALQAGGMCLTSEWAEEKYAQYGWSEKCREDGKGGAWSNQVWRIREDWWESSVDWWKVPEMWRPYGNWNCTWRWWKTPTTWL